MAHYVTMGRKACALRTWEDDEGFGGDPDAGRGGNYSSGDQTRSRNEARNQRESKAAESKKGGFWSRAAKIGKGVLRGAAAYATGGLSETAIKAGKAVKGWADRRSAQTGARVGGGISRNNSGGRNDSGGDRSHDGGIQRTLITMRKPVPVSAAPQPAATQTPTTIPTSITAPNASVNTAWQNREVVEAVYPFQSFQPFYPVASYYPTESLYPAQQVYPMEPFYSLEPLYQSDARTWDDDAETLEGLSKSLKKIGKKLKSAVKPKNLLKTAAVAAAAYGGYKLLSSPGGQATLSKIGSGLAKVSKAVVSSAPQIASTLVAYKAATTSEPSLYPEGMTMEEALQSGMLYNPQVYTPQSLYAQPGLYPGVTDASVMEPTAGLPSWVLPAGIGLVALLLLKRR